MTEAFEELAAENLALRSKLELEQARAEAAEAKVEDLRAQNYLLLGSKITEKAVLEHVSWLEAKLAATEALADRLGEALVVVTWNHPLSPAAGPICGCQCCASIHEWREARGKEKTK